MDLMFLAKLIPRILHNVNRVCYIFGEQVQYQVTDITHTTLNLYVLKQLRQADAIANEVVLACLFSISLFKFTNIKIFLSDHYASRTLQKNLANASYFNPASF